MEKLLEELWPVVEVDQGLILSGQGDVTIAFQVELPEIFSLSEKEYEMLHQAWVKALKMLPSGTVFHKQDYFNMDSYKADPGGEQISFLSRASERFFHERPYLAHQCYVMLTRKPQGRRQSSSLFSSLLRPSLFPGDALDNSVLADFKDAASQFARVLEDTGLIRIRQLEDGQLLSSPSHAGLMERYYGLSTEKDRLLRDIEFKDGIKIGEQYAELYTISDSADLPSACGPASRYEKYSTDNARLSIGFASPVGQLLPCSHIINQFIFIEDGPAVIRRLESKRLRLQSLSVYARENALALDATNEFLNEAVKEQRLPVRAHFNVLVWTPVKSELQPIKSMIASAFAQMDVSVKIETTGAPQIFWAGIPGNEADFPMNETFETFTEQACCFLNTETGYRSSISPVGIRLGDRLTGKPIHVDISDEPVLQGICTNRNKFILGPSGSGKSFFTNHMIRSYYEQGAHVVIVDVGHSYKGLCDLVGGYYFTYEEKNPIRFNPFYIEGGSGPDTEKKESIKTLLLALWKKDSEDFKRSEYVALSNALTLYYQLLEQKPAIRPCFDSFYDFLREDFTAVLANEKVKDRDFDVSNFLYVLRPYYKGGEFDYLLNASENLDLQYQRFIVFELDQVKDHPILFPVITIIIMEVFIAKMRKLEGIRKIVLIEEAWKAIAKEGMAEYIRYLFKTVRKFFGEAIVVTQEVEDIISSPVVKQAIINNSDCKILLDQSKYQNKFDQIQQLLGLTEKEKAMVLSVNKANDTLRKYKEVFISLGGTLSRVYRTEVSTEEYLAYTTEQTEKMKVAAYGRRYGGIREGIQVLASELREGKR
jgi:conjugation system TraG family ATPase